MIQKMSLKGFLGYPVQLGCRSVVVIHRLFPAYLAEEEIGSRSFNDANATRWRAKVGCFVVVFNSPSVFDSFIDNFFIYYFL